MEKSNASSDENKTEKEKPFEIPTNGSLGLLALGAVGIKAWREKRKEELLKLKNDKKNE
ncbi:MAG: hypothetical protein ACXVDZ_03530 [Bacteroidia bacterium]